jgi:ABC-type anion transport system duplicated permease subunit
MEAKFIPTESVVTWALQMITQKPKMNRAAKGFNSRMFYQTYINSPIPHIAWAFFMNLKQGVFYIFASNGQ